MQAKLGGLREELQATQAQADQLAAPLRSGKASAGERGSSFKSRTPVVQSQEHQAERYVASSGAWVLESEVIRHSCVKFGQL